MCDFQNKNTDIKENGLDESMEVDNNEKVEDGKAPPDNNLPVVAQLKKEISKSGLDMIKHMVTEVDHEGYTPLLCACRSYMKFTVSINNYEMTENQINLAE